MSDFFVKRDFINYLQENIDKRFSINDVDKGPIVGYLKHRYGKVMYWFYEETSVLKATYAINTGQRRPYPFWLSKFVIALKAYDKKHIYGYECQRIICPINEKREKMIKGKGINDKTRKI